MWEDCNNILLRGVRYASVIVRVIMICCTISSSKILLGDQVLSREYDNSSTNYYISNLGSSAHVIRHTHLYTTTSNVNKMVSLSMHCTVHFSLCNIALYIAFVCAYTRGVQ